MSEFLPFAICAALHSAKNVFHAHIDGTFIAIFVIYRLVMFHTFLAFPHQTDNIIMFTQVFCEYVHKVSKFPLGNFQDNWYKVHFMLRKL